MNANASTEPAPDNEFVELLVLQLEGQATKIHRPVPAGDGVTREPALAATETLVDELRSTATWTSPPSELRVSILNRVRTEAAGAAAAPEAAGAAAAPGAEAVVATEPIPASGTTGAGKGRTRRRWSAGRLRLVWAVPAAALAAAVFTAGVLAVDRALQPDPRSGEVYVVTGTGLAPEANVTASVAEGGSGFSIWLRTSGLPAAAPGSYYAAWLRGPRGTVALGSFHGRGSGERIELWSGVDPSDYPIFLITLQAEGGPSTPSTLVLVTGSLVR